jgi:hypothetical protein
MGKEGGGGRGDKMIGSCHHEPKEMFRSEEKKVDHFKLKFSAVAHVRTVKVGGSE